MPYQRNQLVVFDAPSNEISNNFIYQQEIPLCTYHPTLRLSTTEEHVQTLRQAFEKARRRLLIVSLFISIHAIENDQLIPLIRHTVQRGVDVTIYTDSSLDYDMKNKHLLSHAKDGRNALIESGVTLIEVKGIHNKSLAIDNHTLIEGSFNWLSANRHKEYSRHECSIIVSSFQADEYINNLIKELESREKTFPFGLYLAPYCGYTLSLFIGFVLFLLQVQFCKWWLKGHKQGPLESIWHKWTWMCSKK
jgi:hypothetical protein